MEKLKIGKLPNELLEKIVFEHIRFKRPEVLSRPKIGEDCAAIDFGEYECVMSTDPITAAVERIGSLAVHISCNDIAANGVAPLGILLAVLLPEGSSTGDVEKIAAQAAETAAELEVEIIGGHTEITPVVKQPVIISTAVGRKPKAAPAVKPAPGHVLLVSKQIGIEGSGIIASDHAEKLKGVLSEAELAEAKAMLGMVSVVKEGVIAGKLGASAMHDITEGGLLGAVWEVCEAAGLGAAVYEERIPIAGVTQKICGALDLNPLRLISSGAMLIVAAPEKKAPLMAALSEANVLITEIGVMTENKAGLLLVAKDGRKVEVEPPGGDEVYRV